MMHKDAKWSIRATSAQNKMFLYVDVPAGEDDGSLEDVLPWAKMAEEYNDLLFLFGDYSGIPKSWEGKKVFKTSCPKSNPNAIAFFHPVVIDRNPKPIEECRYFSGFQGSMTHPCRNGMKDVIQKLLNSELPAYFIPKDKVFWSYEEDRGKELKEEYLNLLEDTAFPLCPRGKGLNSIRFFESLRLGRIPVLISDDPKLPLEGMLNYDDFVVRVPESEVGLADEYIAKWISKNDITKASSMAQEISNDFFEDPEKFIKQHL